MAKIANLRPKIGQMPLLSLNINGHNSVIFDVIYFKLLVFSKRIEWCQNQSYIGLDFGVWPHFCSEASHWLNCAHGPKTTWKIWGRVLAFPFNSYLKIKISKIIGLKYECTRISPYILKMCSVWCLLVCVVCVSE